VGQARLRLLLAHPGAAWKTQDLRGLAGLAVVGLVIALLPGVFILPIYAVGALCARRGSSGSAPVRFGLREAWLATALVLLAECAGLLVYPGALDTEAGYPAVPIARFALLTSVGSIAVILMATRRKALHLTAAGRWRWPRITAGGVLLAILFQTLVFATAQLAGRDPSDPDTTGMVGSVQRSFGLGMTLLCVAVLIPITEEILFRGVLLSAFGTRLPASCANAAQAFLFGVAHFNPVMIPGLFLFGLAAGRLTRSSGSLRPALLGHMLVNGFACFVLAWRNAA
jgi:membrane protease YdiL (CAAX protease family)